MNFFHHFHIAVYEKTKVNFEKSWDCESAIIKMLALGDDNVETIMKAASMNFRNVRFSWVGENFDVSLESRAWYVVVVVVVIVVVVIIVVVVVVVFVFVVFVLYLYLYLYFYLFLYLYLYLFFFFVFVFVFVFVFEFFYYYSFFSCCCFYL